ncbi:hypothetical protein GKJPGBOP_01745 [Streptomyces paromomycinus]|uniref:Uncharacterized protein n=1 Tax=Streptomyces paromomycinus TaxID=92743 RepID=A0A401VYE5_STREY|nr:hypothetical protein GKJPGBOP_01745 [Streptomyces paromomycinus]
MQRDPPQVVAPIIEVRRSARYIGALSGACDVLPP